MTKQEMAAKLAQLEIDNSALRNHIGQSAGASVTVPGFVTPPKTAPTIRDPRTFKVDRRGVSDAGFPWTCYITGTKNGGSFKVYVPDDLRVAIKAGL